MSVAAPAVLPWAITDAPINGSDASSSTVPLTVLVPPCAFALSGSNAIAKNGKSISTRHSLVLLFIVSLFFGLY